MTLSLPYDQTVTVKYYTQDITARAGEDYVATSGTLTFAPGETSKTFTVVIKGDKNNEPDESFYIWRTDPSSNAHLWQNYGWVTSSTTTAEEPAAKGKATSESDSSPGGRE